jgi:FkbM family methyltransferase
MPFDPATRFSVPIFSGPLAGARWLPLAGGKVLRYLRSTYEPELTGLIGRTLRPGDAFFDLGANIGYFSLLASRRVGPTGRVVAVEPEPGNLRFLRRHVELNAAANVVVVGVAVGRADGVAGWTHGTGTGTGRLNHGGRFLVPVMSLETLIRHAGVVPTCLKIDIEGAEAELLAGARDPLARHRPALFLSIHGDDVRRSCLEVLAAVGYRPVGLRGAAVERADELFCPGGA